MGVLRFLILPLLIVGTCCTYSVTSQSGQQQQPQQHPQQHQALPQLVNQPQSASHQAQQNIPENVIAVPLDSADVPVTNHYPYQSSSLSPSSGYHQPYSGSTYGNRDVGWGSPTNQAGWSTPYFGVSTGTAWELSAYFGPVFWGFVAIVATFGFCVGVSRFLLGGDIFGGMFRRISEAAPTGKSLDLDNITNMVYQALDTYGRYAAKDARYGSTEGLKG